MNNKSQTKLIKDNLGYLPFVDFEIIHSNFFFGAKDAEDIYSYFQHYYFIDPTDKMAHENSCFFIFYNGSTAPILADKKDACEFIINNVLGSHISLEERLLLSSSIVNSIESRKLQITNMQLKNEEDETYAKYYTISTPSNKEKELNVFSIENLFLEVLKMDSKELAKNNQLSLYDSWGEQSTPKPKSFGRF